MILWLIMISMGIILAQSRIPDQCSLSIIVWIHICFQSGFVILNRRESPDNAITCQPLSRNLSMWASGDNILVRQFKLGPPVEASRLVVITTVGGVAHKGAVSTVKRARAPKSEVGSSTTNVARWARQWAG